MKSSSWPYGGHKPSSFHHLNTIAAAVPQFAAFYTVTSFTDGASELPSVPSICWALTPSARWLSGVSTNTHADCSHCCQRDYAKFHSSRRRPLIGVISPCWDATALRIFANLNLKVSDQNIMFSVSPMERLYMEAQDGLKTIAPPLFLNIFFYFLLV